MTEREPATDAPESDQPAGPRRMTFGEHAWAFVKELATVVIGAIVVASLVRYFVGQMFIIPSQSMENTLQISDRVVVEKLSSIKRGQVVVFKDPGGWLSEEPQGSERGPVGRALEFVGVLPDSSADHLIKRAVGLPGDQVICCDAKGRITVNDQPLDETSYLYTDPSTGQQSVPSDIRFDVTVPAGRIFVLGDNREDSRDSRCHLNDPGTQKGANAFVPENLVVGRAIAIAWPLSDAKALHIPATYASVPPGKNPPSTPVIHAGADASC